MHIFIIVEYTSREIFSCYLSFNIHHAHNTIFYSSPQSISTWINLSRSRLITLPFKKIKNREIRRDDKFFVVVRSKDKKFMCIFHVNKMHFFSCINGLLKLIIFMFNIYSLISMIFPSCIQRIKGIRRREISSETELFMNMSLPLISSHKRIVKLLRLFQVSKREMM